MSSSPEPSRIDATRPALLTQRALIAAHLAQLHRQLAALASAVSARDPVLMEMTTVALALAQAPQPTATRQGREPRRRHRWGPPRRRTT